MGENKKSTTKNIKRLDSISEDRIDYSDIKETDESFWANAGVHMPKNKRQLTLRLDPDVIDWYKQFGKGYQTRMSAVLRKFMEDQKNDDTRC